MVSSSISTNHLNAASALPPWSPSDRRTSAWASHRRHPPEPKMMEGTHQKWMEEMEKLDITNLKQQDSDLGVSKNDNNWDISYGYTPIHGNFHSEKMINPWFWGYPGTLFLDAAVDGSDLHHPWWPWPACKACPNKTCHLGQSSKMIGSPCSSFQESLVEKLNSLEYSDSYVWMIFVQCLCHSLVLYKFSQILNTVLATNAAPATLPRLELWHYNIMVHLVGSSQNFEAQKSMVYHGLSISFPHWNYCHLGYEYPRYPHGETNCTCGAQYCWPHLDILRHPSGWRETVCQPLPVSTRTIRLER